MYQAFEAFVCVVQRVCSGLAGLVAGQGVVGLARVARPSGRVTRHWRRAMFQLPGLTLKLGHEVW